MNIETALGGGRISALPPSAETDMVCRWGSSRQSRLGRLEFRRWIFGTLTVIVSILHQPQRDGRMLYTVQFRIDATNNIGIRMAEMREWLDEQRFEPDFFQYRMDANGMVVRVDFKLSMEADAFRSAFGEIHSAL